VARPRLQVGRGERIVDAIEVVEGVERAVEAYEAREGRGDRLRVVQASDEAVASVRLGVGQPAGGNRLDPGGGKGLQDLVAHVHGVVDLLDAPRDRQKIRVGGGGGER